jgi:hypothetical protein
VSVLTDQQELAMEVLRSLEEPLLAPSGFNRLTIDQAQEIVDLTIEHVQSHGYELEHSYLSAHRRRLAESLSWIPLAPHDNASCIDIGCFGYMGFWAQKYLGYRKVDGIEYRPGQPYGRSYQNVTVDDFTVAITIHNFDISDPEWMIDRTYNTVLFFETLEHVCSDPVGIMTNIGKLMTAESVLVMSVPNCISYKTLREFICGTPPWIYWFFHPDLSHEPRHCFEYTPFILKMLLRSSGFEEKAFKTLYAFSDEKLLVAEQEIAQALSINSRLFGDVLLSISKKISPCPPIRYPSCIYDADAYYKEIWPILWERLQSSIQHFKQVYHPLETIYDERQRKKEVTSFHRDANCANRCQDDHSNNDNKKERSLDRAEYVQRLADKDILILDLKRELGEWRRRFAEIEASRPRKKLLPINSFTNRVKRFLSALWRG